jgi:hypothetical protein
MSTDTNKKCLDCGKKFEKIIPVKVSGGFVCSSCVCPDDDAYICYSCGEKTGHGMDSGQCNSCAQLENPDMY